MIPRAELFQSMNSETFKKKVLLISNVFPNAAEKERGIFTYRIAMALKKWCRIEVAAPLPWVPPFMKHGSTQKYAHSDVPELEIIGGLTIHHPRYLVIPKVMGFMHPVFMFKPLLRLIMRLDSAETIDLINAHWLFPDGVVAAWVAKKLGKPIVLTGLGCDINHYPLLPFRKGMMQRAMATADAVTVKGNSLKEKILRLKIPDEKISVIPNGVDLRQFKIMDRIKVRQQLGICGNGPFLLTAGSLDSVKGTHYLLEALKEMSDHSDILPRLLMVGDGPLKEKLFALAKQLQIIERVSFLGKRPHDEIPLWMNAADLFCLPSIREGRPNVLMEALACGTPAVASNVGSVPELIRNENGRITEPENPGKLCLQILACLEQSWDRKTIRKTVGNFSWESSAERYIRTYQQVLRVPF
jgi:teichuronic acid biosynthesis glycosyltransferase TuaC